MTDCFYIAPDEQRILANISVPQRGDEKNAAVLLCYPFGQEYMRAHRTYRQLASLLNRKGFTVMRFDYPGTGDSYGDAESVTFHEYTNGAQRALEALKQRSGKAQIYVVGLRLGALVAAKLASLCDDIRCLVLWDPFPNGVSCLTDSEQQRTDGLNNTDHWWLHGFPMPLAFRDELGAIDLLNMGFKESLPIHQVISHENSGTRLLFDQNQFSIQQHVVPPKGDWNYVDDEGSILMPTELIKKICSVLASNCSVLTSN